MKRQFAAYAAITALFVGTLTGCSTFNDHRGRGDAPVKGRKGDDSPAWVTNMPDTFPNAAVKCVKGFAPWAFAVTTDRTMIMFQAPAQCGGKPVPGMLTVEGN